MPGEWNPDPSTLEQVGLMLTALRDPTRSDHQNALASLENDTSNPEFILHLLEVFAQGEKYSGFSIDIRQLAGLIIKNYVFRHLGELNQEVFSVVKQEILNALVDSHHDIRNTAGILMGRICDAFSFETWSNIVEPLVQLLQSQDPIHIDGALNATKRMCEDACEKLSMDTTMRPLEYIVPCLLELFKHQEESFRLRALESLNSLIFLIPSDGDQSPTNAGVTPCALVTHMHAFLEGLSALSSDSDGQVRRAVCQAIVLMSSHQLATLVPLLDSICTFMLQSVIDHEEQVAMEACEFWWVMMESIDGCNFIVEQHMRAVGIACTTATPNNSPVSGQNESYIASNQPNGETSFLGELIPSLISRLPLTAAQIEFDRSEEEAEDSGEKEVNFKPIHYNSRSSNREDEGEGQDGGDGETSMWTVRREAARVLDVISCAIPAELTLNTALPVLQANLQTNDVWTIEAGMLGLGALSRGCADEMAPYLPDLLPFLIGSVNGSIGSAECPPELRCVSAWVVGRYSYFWFDTEDQDQITIGHQRDILSCLLESMLQGPPKFQAAACAALCAIFENCSNAQPQSDPEDSINILHVMLGDILQQINRAFGLYGVKNTLILCDTLATLCDCLGECSLQTADGVDSSQALHHLFLPPLLQKFYAAINPTQSPLMSQAITSGGITLNPYVFPIMECITSVYPAVGREIAPYSCEIVKTCLYIIQAVLDAHRLFMGEEDSPEPPSKDFLVCSLDVISGVIEGLGGNFANVVLGIDLAGGGNSEILEALLRQLLECLLDENSEEVRQSAFSLFGDLVSKGECVQLFFSPPMDIAGPLPHREDTGAHLMELPCDAPAGIAYMLQLCMLNMNATVAQQAPLVANNAVWAAGEMCLALGRDGCAHVVPVLAHHVAILLVSVVSPVSSMAQATMQWEGDTPIVLKQNLAIALGRLCMLCPEEISTNMENAVFSPDCVHAWCRALKLVQYSTERDHAFAGIVALVNLHPQTILQDSISMEQFVLACASWDILPGIQEVAVGIRDLLLKVRSYGADSEGAMGVTWSRLMGRMDENTVRKIHGVFELQNS